ncbi:hypothetical protein LQW54_000899 [Pestalotiopsis sp. IQ-011]
MSKPSLLRRRGVQFALALSGTAGALILSTRITRASQRLKDGPPPNNVEFLATATRNGNGVIKTDVLSRVRRRRPDRGPARPVPRPVGARRREERQARRHVVLLGLGLGAQLAHPLRSPRQRRQGADVPGDRHRRRRARVVARAQGRVPDHGPRMVRWLEDMGYTWTPTPAYPDYFPYNAGAQVGGRTIEAGLFDVNLIGAWRDRLNINPGRAPLPL